MANQRLRLSAAEVSLIQQIRQNPNSEDFLRTLNEKGIDPRSVRQYWDKDKRYSIQVRPEHVDEFAVFNAILEDIKEYSPKFDTFKRKKVKDPHCLIIDPADIHVGKLATEYETGTRYDIAKAVSQVDEGVEGIINKSFGFNIDKVIFVIGNDCLHIDNARRTTTSGTPQDTDGMWYDAFLAAKAMYVRAIERLLPYSDVTVIFNPSNHDYVTGFMLAQTIEAYFRWSKNVTFDTSISHRKYTQYGVNMIATSHGDGAKLEQTPLLMATENPQMWNDCPMRYIYLHHIHHKQTHKFMSGKDYIGVTAEFLRTPSPSDSWHHRNGYVGAKKAIEGFIHSFTEGQVCRLTHYV